MGVEHYMVCKQCKEYIDLHKAYVFNRAVVNAPRPAPALKGWVKEISMDGDELLNGGYWETRAAWFLWEHRGHTGVDMHYDCNDEWYELEPHLKEVYRHEDDIKLREKYGL